MTGLLRIVHLVSDLSRGGTQRQVTILAKYQRAHGHDVTVLVYSPTYDLAPELEAAGVHWRPIPQVSRIRLPFRIGGAINFLLLVWAIAVRRPHIIHSHGFLTWPRRAAIILHRLTGAALVHKEVNVPGCFPQPYAMQARSLAIRTGHVIANSKAVFDGLIDELGYDPANMSVVHNILDTQGFPPMPSTLGPLTVGMIARFDPEKRHEDFLQAAALCVRQEPAVRFVLFGRDEGVTAVRGRHAAMQRLAGHLGIEGLVEFAGPFAPPDLPSAMSRITVYTQSSEYEGLPNAVMEAMWYERPCVVTDAGGASELIEDGVCGFVVPIRKPEALAEAWLTLLRDESLRRSMGARAHERIIELCAPEHVVGQLDCIYRNLIGRKAG